MWCLQLWKYLPRLNFKSQIVASNYCSLCFSKIKKTKEDSVATENVNYRRTKLYCNNCDFSSFNKKAFKKHNLEAHDIIKPFVCTSCDYKSDWLPKLKRHTESVHEGKRPFKCTQCKAAYSAKGQLISEWLFDVLNFPKKQLKIFMTFCPRIQKVVESKR